MTQVRLTAQKELIPAPERGPSVRGPQDWESLPNNYQFYSGAEGEKYIDIVVYNGYFYECKTTHQKKNSRKPGTTGGSTYWTLATQLEFVATHILLATYALVKNLGVEAIEMTDSQGNILFTAKDGVVTCNTGNFDNIKVTNGEFTGKVVSKNFYHNLQSISSSGSINATTDIAITSGTITVTLPTGSSVEGKIIEVFCVSGTTTFSNSIYGGGNISVTGVLYTGDTIRLYYDGTKWRQLYRYELNPKDISAESVSALNITQTYLRVTSSKTLDYTYSMYVIATSGITITLPYNMYNVQYTIIVAGNFSVTLKTGNSLHKIVNPSGGEVTSFTLSAYKHYTLVAVTENLKWYMGPF